MIYNDMYDVSRANAVAMHDDYGNVSDESM